MQAVHTIFVYIHETEPFLSNLQSNPDLGVLKEHFVLFIKCFHQIFTICFISSRSGIYNSDLSLNVDRSEDAFIHLPSEHASIFFYL